MNTTRKIVIIAGLMSSVSLLASGAYASSLAIRTQSAHGLGTAYAGAAANPGSLSYMFFNPATISDYEGYTVGGSGTLIAPESELTNVSGNLLTRDGSGNPIVVTPITGGKGESSELSMVPALYGAAQLTDQLSVGVSLNAPFGTSSDWGEDWGGRLHATKTEISSMSVNPVVSYRFSDKLTLAGGVQAMKMEASLGRRTPLISPTTGVLVPGQPIDAGSVKVEADDVGFGFTLGVLGEVLPGTRVGLSWRSEVKQSLEGTAQFGGALAARPAAPVYADMTLPQSVHLGVSHDATERLSLLLGLEWTGWSSVPRLDIIKKSDGLPLSETTLDFDDTFFVSVGAEYDLNDSLTLRGGLGYDESPTPSPDVRSPISPDSDRFWLSLGGSYHLSDALSLDLGYTFIKLEDATIGQQLSTENGSRGSLSADAKSHAHVLAFGANFSF